ncbi:MAG: lamin tail domain-containing protein, partial [Verrucomicrobiales bacterium]|nr:lamin tail domain-containing protein [Verrucomicrobiales bacterium]
MLNRFLSALAVTLTLAHTALAAPITIGDHSFENASLGGQNWSNDLSPEWIETGGPSATQAFEEFIADFSADGQNHLGMIQGHNVWQDLGASYQSNTRYTLTVAVGHRGGSTNPDNTSTYTLSDPAGTTYTTGNFNASNIAAGTFTDAPAIVFETPDNPAAIGKTIRIALNAGGSGRTHFDHIRLDAQTLSAPEPPAVVVTAASNVSGASATLNGNVTRDGNESPTITFYYGTSDAGTSAASWQHNVPIGTHSAAFATSVSGLDPQTTYHFRALATNSAGSAWSPTSASFSTTTFTAGNLVINEIHYNDDNNTALNEFIEIYNNGDQPVDAAGYQLAGGIRFTVPAGTSIPSRGYLVVAEFPANVSNAIGPYDGRLSGKGERLSLLDPSGTEIDRVDYASGFPWPSRADGGGASMELINPTLDNDLGSSWRSSATGFSGSPATFVTPGTSWSYRKGTSEASTPTTAWRQINFPQDDTWLTGNTSIGFSDNDDATVLDDMQNNYSTFFLRKPFTITGDVPTALTLRLRYDDGAIVYINGVEVARTAEVDPGELNFRGNQFDDPSTTHGLAVGNHEAQSGGNPVWDTVDLSATATYLVPGQNIIAVHALNGSLGSSDASIDVELKTPTVSVLPADPSPGAANATFTTNPPPNIRQVNHTPQQPASDVPVTISAKVTDPDGVTSVSLEIQTVDPGNYIHGTAPAYSDPANWSAIAMTDPDGDATFTAVVPATTQTHRRLVRYRITVTDALGSTTTAPFSDDDSRNFAYFAYDGIPAWTGANQPGVDDNVTFPAGLMDDIATYHVIANSRNVRTSQGGNRARFPATFVYDGIVYDHVEFNVRGEASTTQSGKNKWRFHFNRGYNLAARDNYGKKYASPWDELNLNANASPWAPLHRGMAGIDEAVSFRVYELLGVPSPRTHYLQLRIIDSADEAPTTGRDPQYAGDLWGLYLAVEHPDGSFLDDRGLPDGNVYKQQGSGEKKHQGALQPANNSDWSSFNRDSSRSQPVQWWRDHMHMPTYYSFRAGNRITGNVDIRDNYNSYVYHSSEGPDAPDGRWYVMPWDLDMMYIAETHWDGFLRQQNSI